MADSSLYMTLFEKIFLSLIFSGILVFAIEPFIIRETSFETCVRSCQERVYPKSSCNKDKYSETFLLLDGVCAPTSSKCLEVCEMYPVRDFSLIIK